MSDSFADLWSTTAPLPPKPKPQTLSGASSSSSGPQTLANKPYSSNKPDVFALLASAGPTSSSGTRYGSGLTASAPSSRAMTPSGPPRSSSSRQTPQPPEQAYSQPVSKANSGDAFGDLFASSAGKEANMTLAARLAQEGKGRGREAPLAAAGETKPAAADGGAWAGLDALIGGGLNASTPPPVAAHIKVDDVDDWGLADFGSAPATTSQSGTTNDDIFGAPAAPPPRPSGAPRRGKQPSPTPDALAQIVQMGFSTDQARSALAATEGGTNVPAALESLLSGSSSTPAPRPRTTTAKSLWDLEAFSDPSPAHGTRRNDGMARAQSDSPAGVHAGHKKKVAPVNETFDFGGREDRVAAERERQNRPAQGRSRGLLDISDDEDGGDNLLASGDDHDHEDDILGAFGSPPAEPRRSRAPGTNARPTADTSVARVPSPPPHILGQIVEMGFSVTQARTALAQTPGGLDVAAALESLLSGSSTSTSTPTPVSAPRGAAPAPPRPRGAPKGQKERERERLERMERQQSGSAPSVAELQEHADKLLAQASEIGLSVFSKASAFWGKGKERVVKAYEERAGVGADDGPGRAGTLGGRGRGRGVGDGRPKWMQEAVGADEEERHDVGGFKDDHGGFADDEEHEVIKDMKPRVHDEEWVKEDPPPLLIHEEEEVDLFAPAPVVPVRAAPSTTMPAAARPTQRRPIPTRGASALSSSSSRSIPIPTPASVPDRALPTATSTALATALRHKIAGTDAFKLGQYAAAADAYTAALAALPGGHLLSVPLYTNRALARMKSGDYRGGDEDCTAALALVVGAGDKIKDGADAPPPTWDPSMLPTSLARADATGAWMHPAGHGADLADGYVKALRRRAECREARERWSGATADWEVLAGCAWAGAGVRSEASRGRGRCRGMISGGGSTAQAQVKPPAKPRPTPRAPPKAAAPAGSSKAVAALQAANAAADADDAARASLKDAVDARVLAWRGGKEGNIRALLCSLDAVLWDAVLTGARVKGLHEVVSAAQVKRAYVKAVGRVHPDKLNASNATVEQRMLANAVFGALNEAWIAFQAGQK
ncbi:hypothetical protein HYPSUDRAFT_75400 [Hypholoma sublateritium FD-334 SS-4]|uniref:UBA domain-containing protein n=1 Tax=Hypholoma sublateritium (strain FD-334 SS-4) TaxID=945553 RepID=A0A0D2P6V6_HYPSF|nr:hypothetical protein HYPSUDRAFT_75400 [Hypholoma sublateritium FD-334 SS-4]